MTSSPSATRPPSRSATSTSGCATFQTGPRTLTTTAGDLELRIPKLRAGSFFPSLLERRRRIDQALFAVVMEAYLHGVSTRKVDDLVRALGADTGISKSEVSRICADLDEEVGDRRRGPSRRSEARRQGVPSAAPPERSSSSTPAATIGPSCPTGPRGRCCCSLGGQLPPGSGLHLRWVYSPPRAPGRAPSPSFRRRTNRRFALTWAGGEHPSCRSEPQRILQRLGEGAGQDGRRSNPRL